MDFAHPYLLLLLLLLPALAWLKGRFGQSSAFVYSSVDLVRPVSGMKRSHAGAWLANLQRRGHRRGHRPFGQHGLGGF
jgi:Ca-activated chloride channel family protein